MNKFIELCGIFFLFLIVNLAVMGLAWVIVEKDSADIAMLVSIGITYLIVRKKKP